jgi:LPS sulfotransferase NodH
MTALDATRAGPAGGSATAVPPAAVGVRSSYLICAVPRSGSYLLCEGLRNTGVAGRPTEYFSGGFQEYWSPRWGTPAFDDYMRRAVEAGTTPNGVCGVKAHAPQFDYFARQASGRMPVPHADRPELLQRWLPDLRYVRLRRRDKVRQAVSYVKAIQSNIWWDADQPPAPYDAPRPDAVRFDYLLIAASMARLAEEDDRWTRYFATNGIVPLTLDYEDLQADPDSAVCTVLEFLEVELPTGYRPPAPTFRQQADAQTERWVIRFSELRRQAGVVAATPGGTPPRPAVLPVREWLGPPAPAPGTSDAVGRPRLSHRDPPTSTHPIDPEGALRAALSPVRWWRSSRPFPHARAWPVFRPEVYASLVGAFREYEDAGRFTRGIPGYDVTAMPVTRENAGPFEVFTSRPWHDLLARMFDVDATGEVNISLHHHAVGSLSGSPHNDLNPGWFVPGDPKGEIVVHSPRVCDYRTGATKTAEQSVERVRAIAVIYHLGNPEVPTSGGDTGLYRGTSDPVDRPLVMAPPVNNSLIAFECTPFSYHAFLTNRNNERNCLVMWLHRSKEDVVDMYGEASIVGW